MNKPLKNNNLATIIGSSKIAKIHCDYLRENNYSYFYFIGRKKKKINTFIKKNKIQNASFIEKKFVKNPTTIISICNNTDFHQNYLDYIENNNKVIIVEKPLISVKIFKENYKKKIENYYKKFKKLLVVYPMVYLAKSYNKFLTNKKIKNIKIYYYTKGNHIYENIYIDLLPHCLIFFKELLSLRKIKLGSLKKIDKNINKYKNNIDIEFENVKLSVILKQKYKGKKSKFFFKINRTNYERDTKEIDENFKNFIKIKGKLIEIENPMRQFFFYAINNLNKKKFFNENKKLSIWLSKMTYKIFNN